MSERALPQGPGLVISPHLDDAAFGCGAWLAARPGSVVATVFAGDPEDPSASTDWDRRCGFASAGEAVAARREEDWRALGRLGAEPRWLPFGDSQYGRTPPAAELAATLRALVDGLRPRWLLLPLALFHSDHRLAHDAAMLALDGHPAAPETLFWEDALYRGIPGELQRRLAGLLQAGRIGTPCADAAPDAAARAAKRAAVGEYASQLRAFGPGGYDDVERPERFWRLEPAAPVPEGEPAR